MARQEAEVIGQLAVDTLGDIGGNAHQLIAAARHELGVGAQEADEFRQRAGEARLGLHLFHLGSDARDFRQSDLVDLFGGQVECRVLADLLRVIGGAFGKLARAEGCARIGQVLLAEEGQPFGIGRRHLLLDGLATGFAQALLLIGGNATRHVGEGRPEGTPLGIVDDVRSDRDIAPFERHPRNREASSKPGARVGGMLGEIARDIAHPPDVVLILLDAGKLAARREVGPEIAVAVEGHFPFGEARIADLGLKQRA